MKDNKRTHNLGDDGEQQPPEAKYSTRSHQEIGHAQQIDHADNVNIAADGNMVVNSPILGAEDYPELRNSAITNVSSNNDDDGDDGNNNIVRDETFDHVSDISDPSLHQEEIIEDEWVVPKEGEVNDNNNNNEYMDNFDTADPTFGGGNTSNSLRKNKSFTVCSIISNPASDHESIRSQRENIDRLLMSGTAGGGGSSYAGSDVSPLGRHWGFGERPGQHHHYPTAAHTYDQNYYKTGDWLRFVPRRSSGNNVPSQSSSGGGTPSGSFSNNGEYENNHAQNRHHQGGGHPSYSNTTTAINPDQYYRGFDNTRIRTGFYRYPGATSTRIRSPVAPPEGGTFAAINMNMVGHSGELLNLGPGAHQYTRYPMPPGGHPNMYPNHHIISSAIDEEEGGMGDMEFTAQQQKLRKDNITPPLEIHCATPPLQEQDMQFDGAQQQQQQQHGSAQDLQQVNIVANSFGVPVRQEELIRRGSPSPQPPPSHIDPRLGTNSPSPEPPSTVEEGEQFQSSLRVGGIICPHSQSPPCCSNRTSTGATLHPHIQERKMHEASWDSKYETYACRVDQSQDDRSVEIPIFSMARPHMRAFHFAWLSFFFSFLSWFAIAPLLGEIQISLELSHEQLWTSSICSVAGAVITRFVTGLFSDIYGARWINAILLVVCGVPTMFTGLVNTSVGLSVLRLISGIGASTFVTCQYWTTTMFTKEVAGTANAIAAGWGNLGGAVAQILVGSMLFPMFKAIYSAAGTEKDPAELSWRTSCIIPGLLCASFTYFVVRYSDDSPKGNYTKRKKLGLMLKPSAMKHIKAAIRDHNTWLLVIQYGCCFGVELTTSNAAALYFKKEFELSTESAAAVASIFGWMNLFGRGLGGFLSDISNVYRGMRGRLAWQLICFLLEGSFVMVFSKAQTLGGAITAMMAFSLFVQAAEGSTFGIVPYLNPNVTGTVAGIIGAVSTSALIPSICNFACSSHTRIRYLLLLMPVIRVETLEQFASQFCLDR